MPEFSVIVPVYNVEKYVGRCIESILNQTFADFELILVDDGSTDKSGQICDQYALTDERICAVHQENGGVSKARNEGMLIAKGEFIVFVDSDDTVEDNYLSCMAKVDKGIDLVVCGIKNILPNGESSIKLCYDDKKIGLLKRESILEAIENKVINFVYAKRYKREIIEKNDLCFEEKLSLGEDTDFVVNYLCVSNNIKYSALTLYRYHIYEEFTLSTFDCSYVEKLIDINSKVVNILEKKYGEICSTEIWKKRIFSIYHYSIFEILKNNRYSNKIKYKLLKAIVEKKEFKAFLPYLEIYMCEESKIIRNIISTGSPSVILVLWKMLCLKRYCTSRYYQ